jgi:hypothetical protein
MDRLAHSEEFVNDPDLANRFRSADAEALEFGYHRQDIATGGFRRGRDPRVEPIALQISSTSIDQFTVKPSSISIPHGLPPPLKNGPLDRRTSRKSQA